MGEVVIIHEADALNWANYTEQQICKQKEAKILSLVHSNFIRKSQSQRQDIINRAQTVLFIMSPGLVRSLEIETQVNWNDMILDPARVILTYCGTDPGDLEQINTRRPCHEYSWEFDLCKSEDINKYISKAVELLEQPVAAAENVSGISTGEKKKQSKKHHSGARKKDPAKTPKPKERVKFQIIPHSAKCDVPTVGVVAFHQTLENGPPTIFVEGNSDIDRQVWSTEHINPYTFQFKTQVHNVGQVQLKIVNDNSLLGYSTFTFYSDQEEQENLNQIYIHSLCKTLQRVDPSPSSMVALDNDLMDVFNQDNISPRAFEQLFSAYSYLSDYEDEELSCNKKFPTLIHLAAQYGFQQFCSSLMDLPMASMANCVRNADNRSPADLARKNGHLELADLLEQYGEMAGEEQSLYQIMQCYASMGYYNLCNPDQLDDDDDDPDNYCEVSEKKKKILDTVAGYVDMSRKAPLCKPPTDPIPSDDAFYDHVETHNSDVQPRGRGEAAGGTEGVLPKSQEELARILRGVKDQEYTTDVAMVLFQQWQMEYKGKKFKTFNQKKEHIEQMRTEMVKTKKKKVPTATLR